MRLDEFTRSQSGVRLGMFLARVLPTRVGHALARTVARRVSRGESAVWHTVCANLAQVVGADAADPAVTAMARDLFRHAGECYFDFFHAIGQSVDRLARAVDVTPAFLDHLAAARAAGRGMMLVGFHMSNFDLGFLTLGARGIDMQILSIANPTTGFMLQNKLRARAGFTVTPISPQALRGAVKRLKEGGVVVTGGDIPMPDDATLLPFCGRRSYIPGGPMRLALLGNALVLPGWVSYEPQRGYRIECVDPIEPVRTGDRQADVLTNTARLIAVIEATVRARPEQWLMFRPMWPPADA